ncbi:unnamed protein product [Parnassius apollo]|uniref:(apollo) hypothetical protein n=1 Tax=Parnassius apollo TaxID=110799 RepID=A0A8S3WKB4_PARAO|nr:unnamed protein product [Parnassius apollo]
MGDFNAQHSMWGSSKSDHYGARMLDILDDNNLCLLNYGCSTRRTRPHEGISAPDLTLCSPSLAPTLNWWPLSSSYGSDHFPLIISFPQKIGEKMYKAPPRLKYKLNDANWSLYRDKVQQNLSTIPPLNDNNNHLCAEAFTQALLQAAEEVFPIKNNSGNGYIPSPPWWDKQFETRNTDQRIRTPESRAQEHQEQRVERLQQTMRTRAAREQNIATARLEERQRQRASRSLSRASFVRLAFEYAPDINYSAHSKIAIGTMDKVCQYYQALKFQIETPRMCCASVKVVLLPLPTPPEPLLSLLASDSDDSKLFLRKIRKFNSWFLMTSFGATKICDLAYDGRNFETTFKIQGQVYHQIGSLMPMLDNDPKFLQIYFMGNCEERVTTRCQYNFIEQAEERATVIMLEKNLEDHNELIRLIKRVSPRLQNDNYQVFIKAEKVYSH